MVSVFFTVFTKPGTFQTKMATCYRMCLIPMILRKNRGVGLLTASIICPHLQPYSCTRRFNATVYQKYELYFKKLVNANINDKLKTKQSESS